MSQAHDRDERAHLLDERPASYHSIASDRPPSATDADDTGSSPDAPQPTISRLDLVWILTGLWSAVFLGALDGTSLQPAATSR